MLGVFQLFILCLCVFSFSTSVHALEPQIGRCMMGSCIWTKILNKTLVKSQNGASLYKVQIQEGLVPHMDENGRCLKNASFNEIPFLQKNIGWYSPTEEYVFCSNKLPAVITTVAKIIPLSMESMSYGKANIISVYAPVCHNITVKEFLTDKFRQDNHYEDSGLETILVKKPEKLFELLNPKVLAAYENKI